jgi:hypothetical protein
MLTTLDKIASTQWMAIVLIIASYALGALTTYSTWLHQGPFGIGPMIVVFVVWLLLDVAILVWHPWKAILIVPQIPFLLSTFDFIRLQLACATIGLHNCID